MRYIKSINEGFFGSEKKSDVKNSDNKVPVDLPKVYGKD